MKDQDSRRDEFLRHFNQQPDDVQDAMLLLMVRFLVTREIPTAEDMDNALRTVRRGSANRAKSDQKAVDPEWQEADDQAHIDQVAGELLDSIDWSD